MLNSFVFTSIALTAKTLLGVWLALLLARGLKGKRLIRGVVLLPWVIPTALSVLAWGWMFDSLYSVVNWTVRPNDAVRRVENNYVLPDMVAKAINGMPTKRAMEWANTQVIQALQGPQTRGIGPATSAAGP